MKLLEKRRRRKEGRRLVREAIHLYDQGSFEEAFRGHRHVLSIAHELGDRDLEWTALVGMGEASQARGRADEARDCYRRAIPILFQIANKGGLPPASIVGVGDPVVEAKRVLVEIEQRLALLDGREAKQG